MSQTSDDNEEGIFSPNQSGLSLSDDDENNNEKLGCGVNLKKGPWTSAEDEILKDYVKQHGEGSWNSVQKHSGLFRCGKSCRLRWANHLRPNLKKGAFSAEEERLIIELHAKMGNKWARMAAHLPGRTDNEIKNYWNTRIKRRQRAGLPLYPPEVCFQAFHESQSQNIDGINCGDKRPHSLLQSNSYEIPDIFFNGIKDNQGIFPYFPDLPEIDSSSFTKGFGSSQYWHFMPPAMDRQKGFRESMQFDQGQDDTSIKNESYFGSSYPYEPDPTTKYHLPFGANQGSHSHVNNGNFSASKPGFAAMKSELPSLQYPETDLSSWGTSSSVPQPLLESVDDFIQSPIPTGTVKSETESLHNSGLLDALLYEAKTLGNAKNHSSDKSSDTSTVVTPCDVADSCTLNILEPEWEDYGDSIPPFGYSASETSIFSECTPISGGGSSLDECTPIETFFGHSVKPEPVDRVSTPENERETSTHFSRPDALLGSYWIKQSPACDNEPTVRTDAISQLLGSDCGVDYKRIGFGTSRGVDFYGWNNMRSACQMSDLP